MTSLTNKAERIEQLRMLMEAGGLVMQPWMAEIVDKLGATTERLHQELVIPRIRYDTAGIERLRKEVHAAVAAAYQVPVHLLEGPRFFPDAGRAVQDYTRTIHATVLSFDRLTGLARIKFGGRPSRGWRRHVRRRKAKARRA